MSLRDQIDNATDCKREEIDVPEWGCKVWIRSITAQKIDSWQCETYNIEGKDVKLNRQNIRARLLVRCLVDEKGERLYADNEAAILGSKNNRVVERLYKIAEKLNAVLPEDIEALAKNSSAAQGGDSP